MNKISRRKPKKFLALIICLNLVVMMAVSGTLAYIFTSSDSVVNTFTPVLPEIEIPEEMHGTIKENATIQNTGDVDSFLRARIIVTWQNEETGEVYPKVPELGEDYTMNNGSYWQPIGDYYYYKKIAAPGEPAVTKNDTTGEITYGTNVTAADMLIINAQVVSAAPAEGYTLHIEILGQSIQAQPLAAVQEAWGMTYTEADGTGTWSVNSN